MQFTYDDNLFSDLCKDVYGTRDPARTNGHLSHYYTETPENKEKIYNDLCDYIYHGKRTEYLKLPHIGE